jgi:CRISPR/Cas system CSM-associated protein Csm4 (group 5 of RAMP superfamily)
MCGIFSFKMHYFIVTEKYIIVKNSICFWYNKIYEIENVKELVIESPHKQSTSLRIITNDFQSKMYQAGSLRDKTWTEMKEYLLKKEIKVRNETYH